MRGVVPAAGQDRVAGRLAAGVHGPAYLDGRIEAFLEGFAERLGSMAEEEFEKNRAALLSTKLMKVGCLDSWLPPHLL